MKSVLNQFNISREKAKIAPLNGMAETTKDSNNKIQARQLVSGKYAYGSYLKSDLSSF
jgi:hypothetical protein